MELNNNVINIFHVSLDVRVVLPNPLRITHKGGTAVHRLWPGCRDGEGIPHPGPGSVD